MTQDQASDDGLNSRVYAELRQRIIIGSISPGHELSTRGLAAELGVSQTPVRDALSRLAADGAVAIRSKRRVRIPPMSNERFDDLLACRLLLEPEAAMLALPHLQGPELKRLRTFDQLLDDAIINRDAAAYMQANYDFHFTLYRAQPRHTLTQLIETLWVQFGPYMRLVHNRIATIKLNDYHQAAICAIEAGDAAALRSAIASDISDGMGLMTRAGLAAEAAAAAA
ncbi:MAG: GntR family transcriptional regulator [Hyphomonadaceae bacterium]